MMNDLINNLLLVGIFLIIIVLIFYVIKTYFSPHQLSQLEQMINSGNILLAKKKIKLLLKDKPKDAYFNYLFARVLDNEKKTALAVKYYNNALDHATSIGKVKEEIIRDRLANIYLASGNKKNARTEFLILTKLDSSNADHFHQVSLLFKEDGIINKSLYFADQAIKINPQVADYYLNKGVLCYQMSDYEKAKQSLMSAIKLEPQIYQAHYYLGLSLRQLKNIDWAVKEFDFASKQKNLKSKSQLMKALCYLDREQYNKSIEEASQGIPHTPIGSDTYLNLLYVVASSAERIRDFHQAISNWEEIISISPKFKDVPEKLNTYSDIRTDDNIKDFLIMSPPQFEKLCKAIISYFELSIVDIQILKSGLEAHIVATEDKGKWRNTKKSNRSIYIFRTNDSITENKLRDLHEKMREKSTMRALCITTGDYATSAETFAQSRPIELLDRRGLAKILKQINLNSNVS